MTNTSTYLKLSACRDTCLKLKCLKLGDKYMCVSKTNCMYMPNKTQMSKLGDKYMYVSKPKCL